MTFVYLNMYNENYLVLYDMEEVMKEINHFYYGPLFLSLS